MKRSAIALCIAVLGCGNAANEAPPAASASDAPSAAASTTAATPAPTAAASAEAAAPAAGSFGVVAEGGKDMKIYPLGDGAVVDTGAFIALLGDGPLVQDPEFTKTAIVDGATTSLSSGVRLEDYAGRAPDQLIGRESGDIEFGDRLVFARVNGVWTKQDLIRGNDRHVTTVTAWDDGRAIAAVEQGRDMRFTLVNSKGGVIVPAPGKPTAEQGEECPVRMDPGTFVRLAGLPSGHLFAIGSECKTNKAVAERWEPKKVRGDAAVLEGIAPGAHGYALAAASPEEAYALFGAGPDKTWLATWDGKAWKVEDAPFGAASGLFAAGDGSVWSYGVKGLFRHPKGGAWTKVDAPAGKITSAWAKDEKNVWVVTDEATLLHKGGPAGKSVKLPASADVASVLARDKRWLATPFCKSIYVMLATIGPKGGKVPESFAALSDVVRGAPELQKDVSYVVDDNGANLFVGAKAPSVEVAEKIVAAYKAKNPKATPMVYCHAPNVAGTLKVE